MTTSCLSWSSQTPRAHEPTPCEKTSEFLSLSLTPLEPCPILSYMPTKRSSWILEDFPALLCRWWPSRTLAWAPESQHWDLMGNAPSTQCWDSWTKWPLSGNLLSSGTSTDLLRLRNHLSVWPKNWKVHAQNRIMFSLAQGHLSRTSALGIWSLEYDSSKATDQEMS